MNDAATTYTADQAFATLAAIKSAKAKYDSITSRDGLGGFRYCPDPKVSAEYHAAGQRLFEVADYFFATLTGFKTLNECLEAQANGYRPTFREEGGKDRETVFLAEVYDYLAECRQLPLRAYRPEQAAAPDNTPPGSHGYSSTSSLKPTLSNIKGNLRSLREAAHRETRSIDAKYFRSSGHEVRLSGSQNGFYEFAGEWDGTLKSLKAHAERCRSEGGDTVNVGGQWLCGDSLDGDFEPTDCEWNLSLTVDEILSIGKKSCGK